MGSLVTSAERYPQDRPVGKEREGLGPREPLIYTSSLPLGFLALDFVERRRSGHCTLYTRHP